MSSQRQTTSSPGPSTPRNNGSIWYAAWCWLVFSVSCALAAPVIVLTPTRTARTRIARLTSRFMGRMSGLTPQVRGLEHLPDGPSIIVANHNSYLDGVVLMAVLPPRFAFVIKREMATVPLVSVLLNRLGALFVDRASATNASRDTREILRIAGRGDSIVFFAEGSIHLEPGLQPFKLGAFLTAAHLDLPVVPVTIHGTRSVLDPKGWHPRWGTLTVEIDAPIQPEGKGRRSAAALRKAAHDIIAHRLESPLKR